MPLAFVNGALLYFAHVPRAAGTSIEQYLVQRFGPLAFLDPAYLAVPEAERWSRTSPQHLTAAAMARLVPESWIRHRFAVVRHPQDRIVSVFRFQRDIEGNIPQGVSLENWLWSLRAPVIPHYLDNHACAATLLVPEGATIFRLEDGIDRLVTWLDGIEGIARGPRQIVMENGYQQRLQGTRIPPGPAPVVTRTARTLILELFWKDFERFGYEPRSGNTDAAQAPEWPGLRAAEIA